MKLASFFIALLSVPMFALHWNYIKSNTQAAHSIGVNATSGFPLGEAVFGDEPEAVSNSLLAKTGLQGNCGTVCSSQKVPAINFCILSLPF